MQKDQPQDDNSFKGHSKGHDIVLYSDSFFPSVIKRTEKIIIALYMVSDCLEDSEPLKKKLRSLGVECVSDVRLFSLVAHGELPYALTEAL